MSRTKLILNWLKVLFVVAVFLFVNNDDHRIKEAESKSNYYNGEGPSWTRK